MDPLSFVTAGVNTSIRLFEVTYQLKAVDEQAADLLSTTKHVDRNINEARRLRRLKASLLTTGEAAWIDEIIDDTDRALRGVAKLVEPARVDQSTKHTINFGNRVMWVFRDNPQVRDKHQRLSLCHQSLTAAISCLYSKDVVVAVPAHENRREQQQQQPPPYDPEMASLFEWRRERWRHRSSSNLRKTALDSPDSLDSSRSPTIPSAPFSPLTPAELQDHLVNPSSPMVTGSGFPGLNITIDPRPRPRSALSPEDDASISHWENSLPQDSAQGGMVAALDQVPTLPEFHFQDRDPSFPAEFTPLRQLSHLPTINVEDRPERPPKVPLEHSFSHSDAVDITKSEQCENNQGNGHTDWEGRERTRSLEQGGREISRSMGRRWLAFHATRSDVGHQTPT